MDITERAIISRNENPLANELDGEVIMMDPEDGNYYNLNRVGSVIWDFLETPSNLDTICREITSRFDVTEDVCRKDAIEYIEKMHKFGLMKVENTLNH